MTAAFRWSNPRAPLWTWALVAAAIGAAVVVGLTLTPAGPSALTILPHSGPPVTYSGFVFVAGNCVYCPDIGPPPSYDIALGTVVNITWFELNGYALYLFVEGPSGSNLACPLEETPSGACTFLSTGGTYTLYFHGPVPADEPGYSVNYTVMFVNA
ncbi:MAG TPA: hypothetical protein VFG07_05590 [Thermoplasmata archaeon]|nr:hypothetical protein [Thermoplasmata archaeon]